MVRATNNLFKKVSDIKDEEMSPNGCKPIMVHGLVSPFWGKGLVGGYDVVAWLKPFS